jgi:crotonobetainyl-CoA:carnitine CoA-transferase CaiB-like acyl-CoA transferase
MKTTYLPLKGVKVLDIGLLIPPALTSIKLVALGADVVKVELPGVGDRLRHIPPCAPDGENPQFQPQSRGKRSIALNVKNPEDYALFMELADQADVIVQNQLPGVWQKLGVDFAEMRKKRPALIVCSVTGFGLTGPLSQMPAHGLNMDALADLLQIKWENGEPRVVPPFTSWGNEMGAANAAMAVCAALLEVRSSGQGAWIDSSCWDAIVESHRTELAMMARTGERFSGHDTKLGPLYNTYLSSDKRPVLLGALEPAFWQNFCRNIGREDLIGYHGGDQIEFGGEDDKMTAILRDVFATATAEEWNQRFIDWNCPGCMVLEIEEVMKHPHFVARGIVEGEPGEWPNITNAVRWHHTNERAGSGMAPAPALDGNRADILRDWLGK